MVGDLGSAAMKTGFFKVCAAAKTDCEGFWKPELGRVHCAFVSKLTDLKLCTSSPSWLCLKNSLDGKSRADALKRKEKKVSEKSSQVLDHGVLRLTVVVPGPVERCINPKSTQTS